MEICEFAICAGGHKEHACGCGHDQAKARDVDQGHHHDHEHARPVDMGQFKRPSDTVAVYRILNMDCPMEEALIRKKLASVPGITGLEFNLMQRVLTVEHTPGPTDAIENALIAIDMPPESLMPEAAQNAPMPQTRIPWRKLAWAGALGLCSEICELAFEHGAWPVLATEIAGDFALGQLLAFVLALAAIVLSGFTTYKKGWLAISNFNLNINALMAVAVTGAMLIGQFPEAAMVMVLFNISEGIEALALDRARNAIRELMSLAPDTVAIRQDDGAWLELPIVDVPVGSIARVRPGQKIALDGVVTSGFSTVNQAAITGESMPVEKKPGSNVFAGTINEAGSFEYRTTALAGDTALARIIHAVEDAQATRAPMQRFVDVFAKYYTPAVFLLAFLCAILPPLFMGWQWLESIYTALVLLVIGCPCALVISTPVTVVSGMAAAARKGILIKGGLYLEQGRRLNWVALDKTGTITSGKPQQTDFEPLAAVSAAEAEQLAASLAARSDHPVSKALAAHAAANGVKLAEVADFAAIPGQGVSGTIDGVKWFLGNQTLAASFCELPQQLERRLQELEGQGKTVVFLAGAAGIAALFAVADTVRADSREAIRELRQLNVRSLMLTGDNADAAKAIAADVGLDEYRANLLPGQKLEIVSRLEMPGNVVGMVGDGINDAPALAKANIGFAMAGGGTDTAIETADVALMDDDLRKIPRFIRLSRATHAILVENISLALGVKAIFFALTLTGNATMWMAVFADVGAALLVVANGLRVLGK